MTITMTFEITKPNGIWVSNKKYDNQALAEETACQKSIDNKGETYSVRPVGGHTIAFFEDGVRYGAVAE